MSSCIDFALQCHNWCFWVHFKNNIKKPCGMKRRLLFCLKSNECKSCCKLLAILIVARSCHNGVSFGNECHTCYFNAALLDRRFAAACSVHSFAVICTKAKRQPLLGFEADLITCILSFCTSQSVIVFPQMESFKTCQLLHLAPIYRRLLSYRHPLSYTLPILIFSIHTDWLNGKWLKWM